MEKYLETKDGNVYYDLYDEGNRNTIVFLHGVAVNGGMWHPQMRALANDYAIINIDLRGHGRSYPTRAFSIPNAANDVKAILEKEGRDRYILVGLSMGGYVLQSFVYRYGGAMGYLIADSSPASRSFYHPFEVNTLDLSTKLMCLMNPDAIDRFFSQAASIFPGNAYQLFEMAQGGSKNAVEGYFKQMAFAFAEDRTIAFDAPLMAVCGAYDLMGTVLWHMPDWIHMAKKLSLHIIPVAGHTSNLDNPMHFNYLLKAFAARCFSKVHVEDSGVLSVS